MINLASGIGTGGSTSYTGFSVSKGTELVTNILKAGGEFLKNNLVAVIGILVLALTIKFGIKWARRLVK